MIIDKNNRFVTQRTHPRLATIKIDLDPNLKLLGISINKQTYTLHMDSEFRAPVVDVTIWKDQAKATPASSLLNQWLSYTIGENVSLVKLVKRPTRNKDGIKFKTRFTDGYPFLIANQKSLEKLNKSLSAPIPMNRFRPTSLLMGSANSKRIHGINLV